MPSPALPRRLFKALPVVVLAWLMVACGATSKRHEGQASPIAPQHAGHAIMGAAAEPVTCGAVRFGLVGRARSIHATNLRCQDALALVRTWGDNAANVCNTYTAPHSCLADDYLCVSKPGPDQTEPTRCVQGRRVVSFIAST